MSDKVYTLIRCFRDLFEPLIPVRHDQTKRERDQDSHLDPSHRSLHDVTYNPITNKHMKSYKIGRDRKTTGERMSYYSVHCVLVEFPLLLTCILSVIAAEYGYFSVRVSLQRASARAHLGILIGHQVISLYIISYIAHEFARCMLHTGDIRIHIDAHR